MLIKPKILIVDDEAVIREIYGDFLEQNGFEVATALNVETALESIKAKKPDLILLDIVMPFRNGFDLYDQVIVDYPGIKFVFMTGYDDDIKITDRLSKSGKKWFTKPIKLEEMLEIIRNELSAS
ncbi:MAG: response regulator [Candidatus Neomarinimicrobiota bacterium]|nr:response regulator [Candidatus Neomarinimicrobiota bacterium]HPY00246.1 response regulator [Candidatus Neomarinimicrobiota bacterium]HQQ84506.1 response regulator [Candidatus Neomarinimicrobiota bacterium]